MASPHSRSILNNLSFEKTSAEILEKAGFKITALTAKIAERETRITHIRKEFDISDQAMINLLSQAAQEALSNSRIATTMSYNISGQDSDVRIVGAGVVQNLLTERQLIEQEKESVEKLQLITRNLRPITHHASDTGARYEVDGFHMTEQDLDFLGF